MAFCTACGTQNQDNSSFCGNCGSNMKGPDQQSAEMASPTESYQNTHVDKSQIIQNQGYQDQHFPKQQAYNQHGYQPGHPGILPPRTGWLTFVIVMYWISVVLIIIGALFLFAFSSEFGYEGFILQFFGIMLLGVAGLIVWLIKELNKYNNTARIIGIVLAVLGILGEINSLINQTFNPVNIVVSGLIFYTLAFEQETIALFKPEHRLIP
ncbi:MAG: zinc-ribbon domain-containing protein [Candidatus Heimdallarchaeota archaeon]